MNQLRFVILLTYLSCLTQLLQGQASPSANRPLKFQIGAGYSIAAPDYNLGKIKGISIYGDIDFANHVGIEGDIHKISIWTPGDVGEDTYLLGPRYSYKTGRYTVYGKALAGLGSFQNQGTFSTSPHYATTHGVFSFGGGLDIRARPHLNIRLIDVEFQRWLRFADHGLTPVVATFGAAYTF